ncbi:MAG TPA: aminomethyl-transferring glycine dehydrogenase [Bacteroidota bacterium]|nr:aminomethyl-transferring glycine dehydrogenase [Bacteroidota bacterium]
MTPEIHNPERFSERHIGPGPADREAMLRALGCSTLEEFIAGTVPASLRTKRPLALGHGRTEQEVLADLCAMASENQSWRSLIGIGYSGTVTPAVILRNVLENPGWYTAYTPYQAEIAQGRLEALLTFQTMVTDLTGMDIANASLLDEATAAAEAMSMFYAIKGHPARGVFFVSDECHPQNIALIATRAKPLGIRVVVGNASAFEFSEGVFGALIQYPSTDGAVRDWTQFCNRAHAAGALVACAADIMALLLLPPPGAFGADAAVGSTQRFGVPPGYGGPHAAYFATKEAHRRHMPGRIIGVSVDAQGHRALRMALQTREQHIRREKATSNVCTSQVLLAVMAAMYAVYHGPARLRAIAERIHAHARALARGARALGHEVVHDDFFDTVRLRARNGSLEGIRKAAQGARINFRTLANGDISFSLDELTDAAEVERVLGVLAGGGALPGAGKEEAPPGTALRRRGAEYLAHPVFNSYHSETAMLRYLHGLEAKDLALNVSMIPLGSCTMKLNATTEMIPVTWNAFAALHPFAPREQAAGYHRLFRELGAALGEITGLPSVSLQPNAGAQGEYTGLLVIRAYHESRGEGHRNVCLIPSSAHGTNPASAVMAGMDVVVVRCDDGGNIDVADLAAKAREHAAALGAFMVTYPSTHGVFEESICEICRIVHENGGQVYMDGANMNAQVGLLRPAELGADVCHINLHKTFCIPHGGGGPGMGPIAVAAHLAPFLPGHPALSGSPPQAIGPVAAAPWGSANILAISWAYIAMMGGEGLTEATRVAILNANYMAVKLEPHYTILYRGSGGRVAHEFIVDLRRFKESAGVEAEDVAKRLMDYGFHAPTVSFPVHGTLMIEPTESESQEELDRFCDALIAIREEIREIEEGRAARDVNVLKNAPHTAAAVAADSWTMPYGREKAAFPTAYARAHKFWPAVGRVNNAYGDRNLVCVCPPVEEYADD